MSQNPYRSPYDPLLSKPGAFVSSAPKHSGLGIASFILALISGVMLFAMIGVATYFAATQGDQFDEESTPAILVGLGIIGGLGVAVIGGGLGLAGLVQPGRNKVFAVLGLTFNTLVFVAVCGIMGLGLAMG